MRRRSALSKAVHAEETRFAHTMEVGTERSSRDLTLWRRKHLSGVTAMSGEEAFKLYDTFGLPLDFMQDAARDQWH